MKKAINRGGIGRSWRELLLRPGRGSPNPKTRPIMAATFAQFDGSQLLLLARLARTRRLRQ